MVRQHSPGAEVGIALILAPVWPASKDEADEEAARRLDGSFNRWYLDPLFRGFYPDDAIADRVRRGHLESSDLEFVQPDDLATISTKLDFLGVNYYTRWVIRADDSGEPVPVPMVPEEELTDMGWEVFPDGLYELLHRVNREYKPSKIYITENGAAYADGPDEKGRIADVCRVEYLRDHFAAVHHALADNVPVRGHFVWSLLDNFEWALGYEKRFGLYWVDFVTQERRPKQSAFYYRNVIAANAIDVDSK
jgi:beta-glucosidase